MRAIVNVNKKWGIGRDNDLLINIPEDMKFFRKTTAAKIVIMGRKNLESFPEMKPLIGRVNIVITSDPARIKEESRAGATDYIGDISDENVKKKLAELTDMVLSNKEAKASERPTVLALARTPEEVIDFCSEYPEGESFVIGGASIYRTMLPYCSTCIVTVNDADIEADTYFPDLETMDEWERSETGEVREYEGIKYHFDTFVRV
ncbi:MAG: dihydrofolate reductase [Eubacteriales bacterium]|nr:dihydrofolate reductase [Eubacteriales bacterium]